jgi:hypothetical protein
MTYSEMLQDPRWQKKRLQVLERDKWTCQLCGDTESTLHIHHKKYVSKPWDSELNDLVTYCKHCHLVVENLKEFSDLFTIEKTLKTDTDYSDLIFISVFMSNNSCPEEYAVALYNYKESNSELIYLRSIRSSTIFKMHECIKELKEKHTKSEAP